MKYGNYIINSMQTNIIIYSNSYFLIRIWTTIYEDSKVALHAYGSGLHSSHTEFLGAGLASSIFLLNFSAAFNIVNQSGLLFKLKSISVSGSVLFEESFSPIACRESWFMVLLVSESLSFRTCHRALCWALFSSYYIPAKC